MPGLSQLAKQVVTAPLRRIAPHGLREAALLAAARILGFAHKTNASGNNMSQR
jgi:hypothetical protein